VALGFGVVNLLYVGMALVGFWRIKGIYGIGLLLCFLILRSLFLGSLENPEPRYTLECYPVVIVLASALFMRRGHQSLPNMETGM
jgi:hypothetical protein